MPAIAAIPASTWLLAAAGAAVAGTTTAVSSNQQKKINQGSMNNAKDAAKRQEEMGRSLAQNRTDEAAQAGVIREREAARSRARALRISSGGRSGTVATSPLGLTGSANTAQKTLLGA